MDKSADGMMLVFIEGREIQSKLVVRNAIDLLLRH
jgi:hypothetical protein